MKSFPKLRVGRLVLVAVVVSVFLVKEFRMLATPSQDRQAPSLLASSIREMLSCSSDEECEAALSELRAPVDQVPSVLLSGLRHNLGCSTESDCLAKVEDLQTKLQDVEARILKKKEVDDATVRFHKKKARERAADGGDPLYQNPVLFRDKHPALVPLDPRYSPDPSWNEIAMADLNVVGLPKAGTSQLYKILASHHRTGPYHKGKEYCVSRNIPHGGDFKGWTERKNVTPERRKHVQQALYEFYENEATKQEPNRNVTTVNGCHWHWDIEMTWFYLRPAPGTKKYFFLFRDPADWIWASFNYWQDNTIDSGKFGEHAQWTKSSTSYRSPEFFHELMASGVRTKGGDHLLSFRKDTVVYPRRLKAMVGDDALFLRNEDMLPSVVAKEGGLLDQVASFTGLDRGGFNESAYKRVSNCNDKKGVFSKCSEERSDAYSIAGGRSMLPETRRLIYLQFWEECKIWKEEFGIEYPDCLNAMD